VSLPYLDLAQRFSFPAIVEMELHNARAHWPISQNSAHEGFAILRKEVDELWDEVRKNQKVRNPADMLKELVQIAAMAQRMAEDVVLAGKVGT